MKKFKNWLSLKGLNEMSQDRYIEKAKKLLEYVDEINQNSIEDFFIHLKNKDLSNSTLNLYKYAIKKYLKFKKVDNIDLPEFKVSQKVPESISEEYFLNKVIPTAESVFWNPLKMKAILYLFFYTGIRLRECINLKRKDINMKDKRVKIKGKGDKERIVFFNEETRKALRNYFVTAVEKRNAFNISYKNVQQKMRRLKKYFKKDNVNFHAHTLRHSCATYLLNLGLNLEEIRGFLGHNDIRVTVRYLHANVDETQKKYENLRNEQKKGE